MRMADSDTATSAIGRLIESDATTPRTILVVGDPIIDVWVYGRSLSCQDGCTKFIEESRVYTAGGAAGAAKQLLEWRSRAMLNDGATLGAAASSVKTRLVVGSKITFRHDQEGQTPWVDYPKLRERVLGRLSEVAAVLISDYDKGMITQDFLWAVINECKKRGIPVVADAKAEPAAYGGAIVKGNADYWGRHDAPEDMCYVMTRGDRPPMIRERNIRDVLPPVKCVNHVGAGDCFAAHFALGLAHGLDLADAVAVAHSAGRVYVQRERGRPPTPAEIAADMARSAVPDTAA